MVQGYLLPKHIPLHDGAPSQSVRLPSASYPAANDSFGATTSYTRSVASRVFLLAVTIGLILAGGQPVRGQETPAASGVTVDQVLEQLSTREKVGQLFIVGFQGPAVGDEIRGLVTELHVGGVYLSREACNIINGSDDDPKHCGFPDERTPDTRAQVAGLTTGLQQASCASTTRTIGEASFCLPVLVTIDHEGDGRPLSRLVNGFTAVPSNMAIGATFDPDLAREVGCIVGAELAAVGINMLFGPDLDVLDSPVSGGPGDQGIRVFGGSPLWVAEMGAKYIEGVHQCGQEKVATVAKHFPGHGRSTRNVDYEDVPVIVGKSLDELAQSDLAPFSAAVLGDLGDPTVTDVMMNSHLSYPGVQGCDIDAPVTFSQACMASFMGLPEFAAWRNAGGLTVADDLAAGAVQAYATRKFGAYLQPNIVEEALLAGNDLLPLIRTDQLSLLPATIDQLVARYDADPQVRDRINDAVRRVLALKERLHGGLDPASVTAAPNHDSITPSTNDATLNTLAARAITFIQPSGLEAFQSDVPAPTVGQRILFVECWDDPTCAPPNPTDASTYPPVWPRGTLEKLATEMFPGRVPKETVETISFSQLGAVLRGAGDGDVRAAVDQADWLVFAFLERNASAFPDSEVLKDFLGRGATLFDLRAKTVVVFAYNSPYHFDAGELRNVSLFAALYGKTEASLRASLRALFHDASFFSEAAGGGRLPVDYVVGGFLLYDLSEQVEADPSQTVQLAIDPPIPVPGEEFSVGLTRPLSARNGVRVPNGTAVDFTFTLPDATTQEAIATTVDGIATASVTISQAGDVSLTVSSGDLTWSAGDPIEIGGGGSGPASADGGGGTSVLLVISLAGGVPLAVAGVAGAAYVVWRRRASAASPAPAQVASPNTSQGDGELRLDPATHRVFVAGREIQPPLSREQYHLLAHLYEHAGQLCTRDEIIHAVWPNEESTGISEQAVDSLVHRVRERLRAAGSTKQLVVTVRGQGFRLDL